MIRVMTWINLLGVLVVACLCGRQWTENARARDSVEQLSASRESMRAKVVDLTSGVASLQHDLDTLRGQLTSSDTELAASKQKLLTITTERDRLQDDVAKLHGSLDQWKAAVADRDRSLKDLAGQVQTLVVARDDAVKRYNELAMRFNAENAGSK